ncbi:uncharacterized protein BDCG_06863 [Blastomyces dermatitidis ER-3]|uniref:Uncharacterized protein n=1 Tax=Ajellomyces dermatitidis (strain ER-3 / ATCC MYA-2586) TaxID=559297 RepID=A0ABP2F470_AJEDR|nr:uncharacterized protein BDCG_06863 [Blastomyces dermatitidis ER-3]EEQ91743.2 hypothetical protein BDCG_06863 [Blastomyces dermatitidis ER-3]
MASLHLYMYTSSLKAAVSASADNSELSVESLIENLKNMIMKKLSVSCVARSPASSLASSAASFPAAPSQSSTLASVSGSPAPATPVSVTPTLTLYSGVRGHSD